MIGKVSLKKLTGKELLSDVVDSICDSHILSSKLYKYSDDIYLITSSKNIVRSFLWADSDEAARRAVEMNIEAYSGPVNNNPVGIIQGLDDYSYEGISDWLKHQGENYQESAAYRIAVDGSFIHKKIETEKYSFLFLGEKVDPSDKVYAIVFKGNKKY
ncbi:hypothetical protein [Bacterioplanoides pacificum]|uniref:Uncharacterized protein n=1 Tax=Bacterioplanoides pacificum TaxID=1171596 RepID=A0ABV7VSZ2_9GAMM